MKPGNHPMPAGRPVLRTPSSPSCALLRAGLSAILLCTGLLAGAANWPQFRGPGARGVDESLALATNWNVETGTNVRWQAPLPGLAHASPIIWGDRLYVATAVKPGKADLKVGLYGDITPLEEKDVHQWRLLALDKATGKILWNTLGYEGVPRAPRHPKATACNCTPATDGSRIVAIFGSEGLVLLRHDREAGVEEGPRADGQRLLCDTQRTMGFWQLADHRGRQGDCVM